MRALGESINEYRFLEDQIYLKKLLFVEYLFSILYLYFFIF